MFIFYVGEYVRVPAPASVSLHPLFWHPVSCQRSVRLMHIQPVNLCFLLSGYLSGCKKSCRGRAYLSLYLCAPESVSHRRAAGERSLPFVTCVTLSAQKLQNKWFVICIRVWLSPSLLRVSSFVSFCCAVTFSTVKALPEFSFSDSLLMTEPSSLGNLLQVTIATRKAVSSPEAGLTATLCHRSLQQPHLTLTLLLSTHCVSLLCSCLHGEKWTLEVKTSLHTAVFEEHQKMCTN